MGSAQRGKKASVRVEQLLMSRYRGALADGAPRPDPAHQYAAEKLHALARALARHGARRFPLFFRKPSPPRGLYIWGDVGRGKSMLMDLFFEEAAIEPKRRAHFNGFMTDVHARLHVERGKSAA